MRHRLNISQVFRAASFSPLKKDLHALARYARTSMYADPMSVHVTLSFPRPAIFLSQSLFAPAVKGGPEPAFALPRDKVLSRDCRLISQ